MSLSNFSAFTWLYGPMAEGACFVLTMVLQRLLEMVGGSMAGSLVS